MPTVNPRLTNSAAAPQARNIPTSGPMRNPLPTDSFGVVAQNPTAVGQGISALGQGISRFAQAMDQLREREATTAAEEALVQFEREKNQFFFDPERGYFNQQGRNAYDQARPAVDSLVELQKKYSDNLTNERARELFNGAAATQLTRAQQDIMRHASTQFNAWEQATLRSRLENTVENAGLYWNDPSQRAVQLELGRQTVLDISMAQGLSPETIAENLQTYNSQFATATVEAAIANGAAAGQIALAENRDLLEAPDLLKIQTMIDQKMKSEIDQANSAAAIDIATNLVSQFGELPSARTLIMEEINKIEDQDLRSKAIRESNYQLDIQQRAVSENRAAVFENAEKFMASGGSVDQFITANPEGWQALSPSQQRTLRQGVISTDFAVFSRLLNLPRAELARVNPADYVDKLAESDRRFLEQQVREAITGAPEGQVGRSRTAEVTSTVVRIFGEEDKWTGERGEQVNEFYAMITAEADYRSQVKGSPLTSAEFSQVLNDMTRKLVVEKRFWFDTEETLRDVPAPEYSAISDILRQEGYPVTADNIIRIYRQREQLRNQGLLPE